MDVLWRTSDPLTVREVREALPAPKPAYTTVSTVLERLRGKNMVTRSGSAAQGYRFAPSRSDEIGRASCRERVGSPAAAAARTENRAPQPEGEPVKGARGQSWP